MARWEPNARERLVDAAVELFAERGYAGVTVQEIAARAGLTERTFFRYFADKREVLFGGAEELLALLERSVADAPRDAAPLDVVVDALAATSATFEQIRPRARARRALIGAHAELRERELIKMTTWSAAMAEALRKRGTSPMAATLAGEMGIAIFKVAFERWIDDERSRDLARHLKKARAELDVVVGAKKRGRS